MIQFFKLTFAIICTLAGITLIDSSDQKTVFQTSIQLVICRTSESNWESLKLLLESFTEVKNVLRIVPVDTSPGASFQRAG